MMPLVIKQLSILLWKSWIMRKRHWISALFEIFFPLLLVMLIELGQYKATAGLTVPKAFQTEGLEKPTYFNSNNISLDNLFNKVNQRILYTPPTDFPRNLMERIQKKFSQGMTIDLTPVDDEETLFAIMSRNNDTRNDYGVVFLNADKDQDLKYKIRMKDQYLVNGANLLFPVKFSPGPASVYDSSSEIYDINRFDYISRLDNAFARVQIAINEAYLDLNTDKRGETEVSKIITQRIPYPRYLKSASGGGTFNLYSLLGIGIITGYIVICPLIVKRICDEKVAKAKEMLRMMGMSDWVFWASHFVNFFSVMLFQTAIITALCFKGYGGLPFFKWSNGFMFFISMIMFNISTILSCMLLSVVFNRPVIGVVVSVILFSLSHTVPLGLLEPMFKSQSNFVVPNANVMALTCIMPNAGFQWIISMITSIEMYNHGVSWDNIWEKSQLYGNFSVAYGMLMQLTSIFLYGKSYSESIILLIVIFKAFLIWYVDNVWPFQFGIPKPLWFPFLPSYWFPKQNHSLNESLKKETDENSEYFEKEPTFGKVGIKCQNLQKIFSGKVAVDDVSLNIYSGQITVLLGHNGAGKTTTMNMITGIFPPSKGTALIDDYDIQSQTKKARRSMALCPQENILYNELSVYEHLKLYAVLKDHPMHDLDNEISKVIQLTSLSDKREALSTELSGGMKRKLSLGVAMIANSQILILDEPTSGMDPEARRHMWDVLQNIRSQRTILLTTHYMEEADALGDRIAIMSEGRVKCCGTPMFLKKTFGAGYQLRISKNETFKKDRVLTIIRNYMPTADIKSEIHSEIIYSLENEDKNNTEINANNNQSKSNVLAQLFSDLESRKSELSINSCGLTVTTMEDVFLRVGNDLKDNEMINKTVRNSSSSLSGDQERLFQTIPKNYGMNLSLQQFKGLFLKRVHYAKRYWPMIVMQIVLPAVLFMCILLLDAMMKRSFVDSITDRNLDLHSNYGNTQGFITFNSSELSDKFGKNYNKSAKSEGVSVNLIQHNPDNWTLDQTSELSSYIKTYLVGAQINQSEDTKKLDLTAWYNKEASHTLPSSINILYKTLLETLVPGKSINVHNYPVREYVLMTSADAVTITLIITCLLLIPLTVPFIGASYVLFPIHEKVSNAKLLQLMNGLSIANFWGASYLFDIITHFVAAIVMFIIFMIFDFNKVFSGSDDRRTGLFFMFFFFGFASIPLAYLTSLRLKKPSSGYAVLVIIYLITGLILVTALGIIDLLVNVFKSDIMSPSSLEVVLFFARFLPVFSMSFGIQKIYRIGSLQKACKDTSNIILENRCPNLSKDNALFGCCLPQYTTAYNKSCEADNSCYKDMNALVFGSKGVGVEVLFLVLTGLFYLLVLWLIEGNFERILYFFENRLKKNRASPQTPQVQNGNSLVLNMMTGQMFPQREDPDVLSEKIRVNGIVNTQEIQTEALVVKDLTKMFGRIIPIQAVNHMNFAVHKEECFGLLGVNGAGKTTTFRMLTGDETVTDGNAWIQNYSLRQDLRQFQKQIGYCPQFDALLDKLTGSETLFLFCRLRGMPEDMIKDYVQELVQMVDLTAHVNKRTETYSGGNRRKLSLAIALCAAPPVIFLDEPTSGVDPSARRKIWSTLAYLQERYGSAFILTSHSMEECEALCSRLAIMVNGQFQCLGSVQHLRQQFGQGFTIIAKLRRDLVEQTEYMADLQRAFSLQLPSAQLKDIHQCLVHYHVTDTTTLWSRMFAVMEELKTKFMLEDYIISDTTLEQIFLAFARRQR